MHQLEELSGQVVLVQRGQPEVRSHPDGEWTTAFYKQATDEPVEVHEAGMVGDGVADRKNHGGPDKAVLAYAAENYPLWEQELGQEFSHGGFGENLTIQGTDERSVCIGDHWRIGTVLFEVSQPRQPCWKLGRRWDNPLLPKLVIKNGRSGWYLRVLETGSLCNGDRARLELREHHDWTIQRANQVFYANDQDERRGLGNVEPLAEAWASKLR